MADPTSYLPSYSFSGWQASNPARPLPAQRVDDELANVSRSINETIAGLKNVRRSDGQLANRSVGPDQLATSLNVGFTLRGIWAANTAYSTSDGSIHGNSFYRAKFAHTSVAGTRPDLSPATWEFLFSTSDISGAMAVATYDPQGKMADAFNRVNHTGNMESGAIVDTVQIIDPAAPTKRARFDVGLVAAGQNRVVTLPDRDLILNPAEELIASYTFAAQLMQDMPDLGAYRTLFFRGFLTPASASAIYWRTSTDNGLNFAAGGADYQVQTFGGAGSALSAVLFSDGGAPVTRNAVFTVGFQTTIWNFNATGSAYFSSQLFSSISGSSTSELNGAQRTGAARNALRLFAGSGATISGYGVLTGIRG